LAFKAQISEVLQLAQDVAVLESEGPEVSIDIFDGDVTYLAASRPTKKEISVSEKYLNEMKSAFKPAGVLKDPQRFREYDENGRSIVVIVEEEEEFDCRIIEPAMDTIFSDDNPMEIDRQGIAEWERFEKGIGSKILLEQGYVRGTGLGPKKCGIPIPLTIGQQAGNTKHGLGHYGREKGTKKLIKQKEADEKKNLKRPRSQSETQPKRIAVFDALNQRINKKPRHSTGEVNRGEGLTYAEVEKLLKADREKIEQLKSFMAQQELAYERNRTRDPVFAKAILVKLDEALQEVKRLQACEAAYQTRLELNKERKKLKTF